MKLDVRLFAGLKCANSDLPCSGDSEFTLEVPDAITILGLRTMLGIDPAIPLLCMVNHRHEQEDRVLEDNDRVAIFPPIGGG